MKTAFVLAAAGFASAVSATPLIGQGDRTNVLGAGEVQISAVSLDAETGSGEALGTWYSNMELGNNFSTNATGGVVGTMDYVSTAAGDIGLTEFKFVGGVGTPGGIAFFDFFDAGGTFVDSVGVALTNAGNFIYTITITGGVSAGIVVSNAGFVQMTSNTATNGVWFLNASAATIGSAGLADLPGPTGEALDYKFEITGDAIPTPATAALLGLGGLVATRRRR